MRLPLLAVTYIAEQRYLPTPRENIFLAHLDKKGKAPDGELFISTPAGQSDWSYEEINISSHPDDIGYYLKGIRQDNHGEIYLTM